MLRHKSKIFYLVFSTIPYLLPKIWTNRPKIRFCMMFCIWLYSWNQVLKKAELQNEFSWKLEFEMILFQNVLRKRIFGRSGSNFRQNMQEALLKSVVPKKRKQIFQLMPGFVDCVTHYQIFESRREYFWMNLPTPPTLSLPLIIHSWSKIIKNFEICNFPTFNKILISNL